MIYSTNYEIVQQPQHKSRGEPKSTAMRRAQLKTQRIGNYNGVFFSNLCVYTLQNMYLIFTESVPKKMAIRT